MKFLELEGSASEVGYQHGEGAKEEVHKSLESYERLFYEWGKYSWKAAVEKAKMFVGAIEDVDVSYLEEMHALAKGAGVDFGDILALNARSEIALTLPGTLGGCTSVAVLPPFSEKTYLAQNWDWRSAQYDATIGVKIKEQGKLALQMITEAGIIGKIGLNEAGIGVCLNAIRAQVVDELLPLHLGLRYVLSHEDVIEARVKIEEIGIASAANFLMAQDDGSGKAQAFNMELSPVGCDVKQTKDRYLYHTNHLCSRSVIDLIGQEKLSTTENTYLRLDRMKELLMEAAKQDKPVNDGDVRRWLSDHENKPFSICRHKEPGASEYTDTITIFTVIMDLADRTMLFLSGQPCNPELEKMLTLDRVHEQSSVEER